MVWEVGRGISGVVYEPYKGAKKSGFKGGALGVGKGLVGLVGRPVKGGLTFVAQTGAGVVNTPKWIGKKLQKKPSVAYDKEMYDRSGTESTESRFSRFGISQKPCVDARCQDNDEDFGGDSTQAN